jgi:O-antigen/teichoic acid export membrane protein
MVGGGVIKSLFAKLVEVGLAFATTVLLTRLLGPTDFGDYSLIIGWISFAGLGISLGLSEVVNKYLPRLIRQSLDISHFFSRLFLIRIGLALILSFTVFQLAPHVFTWLKHADLTTYISRILGLFVLIQACNLLWSFYIAQLHIRVVLISNTLRQLATIFAIAWLSWTHHLDLGSVLLIVSLGYSIAAASYLCAYPWRKQYAGRWNAEQFKPAIRFGLTAWATAAITFLLAEQTDILLLGYLVEDSKFVAYYKAGTVLVWKLIGVITVSGPVVLASLSTLFTHGGRKGLLQGWQSFIKISTITVVPSFLFLARYSPSITFFLWGEEYSSSAPILRLFAVLTVVPFGLLGGGLHLMTLYTIGRQATGLKIRLVSGILNLVLGVALIPSYGPTGAVIATGGASIAAITAEYLAVRRIEALPYPWFFSLKILITVGISIVVLAPFPARSWMQLSMVGSLYVTFVVLFLLWLKPLEKSDLEIIGRISPRLKATARRFAIQPEPAKKRD